ncbi:hypothetical protein [Pseudothauera rhizosphaerae]|uniref:Uncharacterized protein n=1 Tax=Pseudothauera rhizosphaerae TaxID=2565932 RepID=A0A4V3WAW9_9RHOO|nr:hypothetical protein [Pseudothauera rhizosphaerae]THF60947.1 hypothetical protein E6O51_12010 [Pseudothauera rhizosphaerae]
MGSEDDQQMDWLRRWVRRQSDDDDPPRGNGATVLFRLTTLHAAAGQLRRYDDQADNDSAAALFDLHPICAVFSAKLTGLRPFFANCARLVFGHADALKPARPKAFRVISQNPGL